MTPLPVSMLPLAGRAVASGGFVVAVLIGLAIFVAAQKAGALNHPPPQR